jgi:hypothetical protein
VQIEREWEVRREGEKNKGKKKGEGKGRKVGTKEGREGGREIGHLSNGPQEIWQVHKKK